MTHQAFISLGSLSELARKDVPLWVVLPAFAALFALAWWLVVKHLGKMARMSSGIEAVTGRLIRESGWGTAVVNGVTASGCVKLAEYENGWLLRMMPLFGGGKLWLAREQTTLSEPYTLGLFRTVVRDLQCGEHEVSLYAGLAKMAA